MPLTYTDCLSKVREHRRMAAVAARLSDAYCGLAGSPTP